MSGGAVIIIIDPNAQRQAAEQFEVEGSGSQGVLPPYDEARAALDAAQAEGRGVRIIGL